MHNADIAAAFEEIADLLELGDENPFRIRAYRNAARVVGGLSLDLAAHLGAGKALPKLPGIGEDLSGKIREIAASGSCKLLEALRARFPAGITELLRLPGVGPKRVRALHAAHIDSLEDLRRAARAGKLPALPRFGEKTAQRIAEAAQARLGAARRFKLAVAAQYAAPLARHVGGVVAGSFRRMRDTVGDIDILVASDTPGDVAARFVAYPEVRQVLARGTTRSSVRLASGIQADLRVVPQESYGAALHYFTGSKSHNIAVRRLGIARGLKINEYGVWRGKERLAGATEESVYAAVGLPYIEPELRENQGELEAARAGGLPDLVSRADLRGDLHAHTRATDGRASAREMALAAQAAGLEYLAITDHSRRLAMARGLDPRRLERQGAEIDELNRGLSGITLLKGVEVDILEDGSLDLPDAVLSRLDVVVAAVHGHFGLRRARQTSRILAALDNPLVRILAHPTGRLIGEREPCDVDMLAVMRKARARGVALELNAHPDRLDLNEVHCRMAKDEGVMVAIGSDAHGVDGFEALRYGVGQARRGWLQAGEVLNTLPLAALRRWLARATPAGSARAAAPASSPATTPR